MKSHRSLHYEVAPWLSLRSTYPLLWPEELTNSELARRLNVSQAAAKHMFLYHEGIQRLKDARDFYFSWLDLGSSNRWGAPNSSPWAYTFLTYEQVVTQFTQMNKKIHSGFLTHFGREKSNNEIYIMVEDLSFY